MFQPCLSANGQQMNVCPSYINIKSSLPRGPLACTPILAVQEAQANLKRRGVGIERLTGTYLVTDEWTLPRLMFILPLFLDRRD